MVQSTYAKYATSATANTNISIARWNILVNSQDIKNNSNFTNTISPTFDSNDNIKEGIIAPTSKGYFDVEIDGTKTDVSYKYTLKVSQSSLNTVTDLKVTSYSTDGGTTINELSSDTIEQTVDKDAENKKITYRFYVEWYDGEDETMDNTADTQATTDGVAAYDININFIQVK